MRRFIKTFLITVFLILITTNVLAQKNGWNFGKIDMDIGKSTGDLTATLDGAVGLSSYEFVGKVGGVALEAVATPEESLRNKKIELLYDSSRPDGNRLAVSIEGQIYHPFLPDWELVPIANYANSKYNAAVSLFGRGSNSAKNFYSIIYHPALNDTLLGVRLLQADIILMDLGEFWQIPQLNQKTILGHGEEQNSVSEQDWQKLAIEIQKVLNSEQFQAWVYTDYGIEVKFSVKDNDLKLSGSPYYYFWKSNVKETNKQLAEYKRQLAEYKRQAGSLRKRGLIQQHNEIVRKHNEIVQRGNNLRPKVFEVTTLTEGMKDKLGSLYKFNPTVYDAAIKTMRFAAFFRYVKTHNNSSWQKFLKQIETVKLEPAVKTPTQWDRT